MKVDGDKLVELVNEKTGNRQLVCQVCGKDEWGLDATIYELRENHGRGFKVGGGDIVPYVRLTCNHCGNTHLLNAINLGIVDTDANIADRFKIDTPAEPEASPQGGEAKEGKVG